VDVGYAVDYGDLRVVTPTLGEVFSNVGCHVELADGTIVKPRACGKALNTRDRASNAIGPGIVILTMCPPSNGLKLTHKVASYENRSGLTIHLEVENVGDAPVQIKALHPIVAEPGDIKQVRMASDGPGGPYVFTNTSENVAILLGTIPLGGVKTELSFSEEGGAITGGAKSAADAPITLAPGERIESDPVMIVFAYNDPEVAREFFGYAYSDATGQAPVTAASASASDEAPAAGAGSADAPANEPKAKGKGRARRIFGRE